MKKHEKLTLLLFTSGALIAVIATILEKLNIMQRNGTIVCVAIVLILIGMAELCSKKENKTINNN